MRPATLPGKAGALAVRAAAALLLGLCLSAARAGAWPVQAWVTSGDRTQLLAPVSGLAFAPAGPAPATIVVDPGQQYQTMVGFGAALTDASAWLLMHRMSPLQREALMQELFGRDRGGLGLSFTRLSIGASDFSLSDYSFDDRPAGQQDPELAHFSLAPQRAEVLPLARAALAINPALKVMASPWSAPGWMKTSDSLITGALRPDRFEAYARYLVRYVEAMRDEGVPVFALTVQNEPGFEPKDYPGMSVSPAARAELDGRYLGPLLRQHHLATRIIEYDHNWDHPESPLAVLADPRAREQVSGVGWHCYDGEPAAQGRVHDAFPDQDTWFTECSGGEWKPNWPETLPWMVRNIVIGSTRNWARGVLLWNLALDEQHGPHRGGCTDCRGVVTIDSHTGEVTRNLEYYALAHASRFVRPGARRIGSASEAGTLDSVAFQNADDASIVLIACNATPAVRPVRIGYGAMAFDASMPADSVATFVWRARP